MKNEKRGQFLLECRKKKKLSQDELGEMISYSRNNISKWERGVSFPTDPNILEKLASIFDVTIEELMYGEHRSEKNEKEIIKNLTDEYKNKYKKLTRKNIIIFSLIVLTILIITTFTYLIFIKGTIKVYKVTIDDKNFILDDSLLFTSNSLSILSFNKITAKNDEQVNYVELYYYDNNQKRIIDGSGNEIKYIRESNGYNEYNLKDLPTKEVFLLIKTDKTDYNDIKVYFTEEYVNNSIFPKKVDHISDASSAPKTMNDDFKSQLLEHGFQTTDNIFYEKDLNENAYLCISNTTSFYFFQYDEDNNIYERLHCFFDSNQFMYSRTVEDIDEKTKKLEITTIKNCDEEKCSTIEDYASYINYIKNLYEKTI